MSFIGLHYYFINQEKIEKTNNYLLKMMKSITSGYQPIYSIHTDLFIELESSILSQKF